ncbi:MAG: glycoside hydrolase family 3 C-terminal domain-containing protein [Dysgonamonadaceae bacterium]|jgi:beta-glucosidase|nr:glycoside hydrolase family 3 C-terminal domain-containing protein [Dysgonamonadaceae bacterium]
MTTKFKTLIAGVMLIACLAAKAQSLPAYLDYSKPIEQRIEDALSRMTLEEKVKMVHAQSKFSSPGVPRLGIPDNWMSDGPHGIRAEVLWDEWNTANWTNDSCIAFPALTCLAATWNPVMAAIYGNAIGEEARYRNKNVLLGPGVNIYRTPLNGRNFEYMGEDPYLASEMVVPYVQGVQKNGVAACVKHYALNNQEVDRHNVNVTVDDRALYEIYLPAFKAAVQKGKAWAIMGAYNKYKDQWACQNEYLLLNILRNEWGFDGVVVSDWGGVNNTEQAIYNGLDMEFGTWTDGLTEGQSNAYDGYFLANPFLNLLKEGKVKEEEVDKKLRNILRLVFRTTMNRNRPFGSFGTEEHGVAARIIASEGIVLLQNNNNVLPIPKSAKKILVVGENAIKMMTIGGGSSSLKAKYEISPLDGLKKFSNADFEYARGYVGPKTAKQDGLAAADITDNRSEDELINEAITKAKSADFVVFIGGLNKHDGQDCEGADRKELGLPYAQNRLISELAKNNKNFAVVILSGNAVAMPWVNEVPAIVESWYLGSEAGNALAEVLFGHTNPSGKLPFTFPAKLEDVGAHTVGDYPGKDHQETYHEGIFVGYRWAEKHKIKPLFPFGHGLSYTQFSYGAATISGKSMRQNGTLNISIPVRNVGNVRGKEVVQLYIGDDKSSLERPLKELKAFKKIDLQPDEEKIVTFSISENDLMFFDDRKHEWVSEPGKFTAFIGASSADIKSKVVFELQ